MKLEQADALLDPGYLDLESGWVRLEDGQLHVAAWTTMFACKGHMVALFPDKVGEGLLKHCHEEMSYLAGFLPALHAKEA